MLELPQNENWFTKILLVRLIGRFLVEPRSGGVHSQSAGDRLIQRVEHDKIVDDARQEQCGNRDSGTAEFLTESLPFAA